MAHAGGRPLKFKSPQELEERGQAFFDVTPITQQTITGLAVFLDTSRETLMNYENRDQFFDTIKKLKDKIEYAYELSLRTRGSAGDIFGLKNFGWKDRQEIEHSGEIKGEYNADKASKYAKYLEEQTKPTE